MSDDLLRVLVLADSRAFHTERYVRELRRQGCHVLVASFERGRMHHFHLKRRGPIDSLHYPLAVPELRTIIKRFRPDVINPHFVSGYGFVTGLAAPAKSAPIALHLWGSDVLVVPQKSRLHKWKVRRGLSGADIVLGDSQFIIEKAERLLSDQIRSHVIPWGIEREYLSLYRPGIRLHKPLKVIVPRPHEAVYRNTFIVRALAPMIQEELVTVTFPAFGGRVDQFRRDTATMVDRGVVYYEKLPRPQFMELMAAHDVYLSNAASDSSPASLIEAMGLGLIPVAADIAGIREWLDDTSGFPYTPYAGEALRTILANLIDHPERAEDMRRQNHEQVKQRAVFEDNIALTLSLMREISTRGGHLQ